MKFETTINEEWIIDHSNFSPEIIEDRVAGAPEASRSSLRSSLLYLYGDNTTLMRKRMLEAESFLSRAEKKAIRWLHTRTSGSEKKNYGPGCIIAVKEAKYRCTECGFSDVRALHLDHVDGRNGNKEDYVFQCLCANCHNIKSYEDEKK